MDIGVQKLHYVLRDGRAWSRRALADILHFDYYRIQLLLDRGISSGTIEQIESSRGPLYRLKEASA